MSTPKRKIGFYSISLADAKTPNTVRSPSLLVALMNAIAAVPEKDRVRDLSSNNRFQLLKNITQHHGFIGVIFKTAKYHHRPPLIDRTATERDNPKKLTEGEAESTHVGLKFLNSEAILLLEERRSGIGIKQILEYLLHFQNRFAEEKKVPLEYFTRYAVIPKGDFRTELEKLARVKVGEVFMEKRWLEVAGLSKRIDAAQDDLILTVRAKRRNSIKHFCQDVLDKLAGVQKQITKLRVYGESANGEPAVLDTEFVKRIDYMNVSLDEVTGQVDSSAIFKRFGEIFVAFRDS